MLDLLSATINTAATDKNFNPPEDETITAPTPAQRQQPLKRPNLLVKAPFPPTAFRGKATRARRTQMDSN